MRFRLMMCTVPLCSAKHSERLRYFVLDTSGKICYVTIIKILLKINLPYKTILQMNLYIIFLVTITLVSAKISVKKSEKTKWYNAKKEMPKRAVNLKKICDKYRRDPDFSELYKEVSDPSQNYVQNWASKLFLCVPAENGALTWNRFFRELHNYDLKVQYKGGLIQKDIFNLVQSLKK